MAWNVVIAGGGFAGAAAARELEKLLPKQSARLILVNDVNFMLYTPFLPEAAAGMLEPRHVVTPLRDMLQAHEPPPRRRHRPRPRGAHGRDLDPRGRGRDDPLRPVPGRGRLGLALAPGPRARPARDRLQEPRRRDLASQPRGRDTRARERDRGPGAPRGATDLRLRRRRLLGPGGARRAPGLRRRRDRPLSARPPARACAGSSSRRWTESCPRSTRASPTTRCASFAGGASTSASAPAWRRRARTPAVFRPARRSRRRRSSGPPGVAPHPSLRRAQPAARRARQGRRRRLHARPRTGRRLVDRRLRRSPGPQPRRRQALPADRAARRPPGQGGRPQHRGRTGRRDLASPVRLPREGGVREPGPLPGRRPARQAALPRLPRLVAGPDLPHEPGTRAWRGRSTPSPTGPIGLPFARDVAEVGSIGHPRPLTDEVYARGGTHRPLGVARGAILKGCSSPSSSSSRSASRPGSSAAPRAARSSSGSWSAPPAGDRPPRRDPPPLRGGRARAPVPALRPGAEALRAGLPRCGEDLYLPDPAEVRHPAPYAKAASGWSRTSLCLHTVNKPTWTSR